MTAARAILPITINVQAIAMLIDSLLSFLYVIFSSFKAILCAMDEPIFVTMKCLFMTS